MKTFLACFVLGLVLFPAVGRWLDAPVTTVDHAAFCAEFEKRYDFTREEAERYLDYCPHFDMQTQAEVRGRRVP